MDVRLSDEQVALRDAVAQVAGRLGPETVAGLDDAARVARLDDAVHASGWRELRVPEEGGEPLASGVEVCLVAEELARKLADISLLGPTLAAELRRRAGAPDATERETIVLGGDLTSLAVADEGRLPTGAAAIDAQGASYALALRRAEDAYALVRVSLPAPDVDVDLTRLIVRLGGATVSELEAQRAVIDDEALTAWLSLALAIVCADLVGTMRGDIELARDYAQQREQYGKHIGSFQAVQHLLADAHVSMEGSRSVALHAAWAADALEPAEALLAASVAKAYCARAARLVGETSIQVHGGIGNTWECLAHVYLRRALLSSDLFGGVDASLTRVLVGNGIGGA
jgi:alkylation response protein AidB-like acyl-CoA dehydrogenase